MFGILGYVNNAKLLKAIYWILLILIILTIGWSLRFFFHAFLLIFFVPPFLIVDKKLKSLEPITSRSPLNLRRVTRSFVVIAAAIAVIVWFGFALLWHFG